MSKLRELIQIKLKVEPHPKCSNISLLLSETDKTFNKKFTYYFIRIKVNNSSVNNPRNSWNLDHDTISSFITKGVRGE